MSESEPRAVATVDLSAIVANVERLREAAPRSELMAVVKAGGYGHGLIESARAARAGGASWLGVALLAEALELRAAGDDGPILAWLFTPGDKFSDAISAGIDVGLSAPWMVTEVAAAARYLGRSARVHLKVDTGLGRSGVAHHEWEQFLETIKPLQDAGVLDVVGVWSHLAYADEPAHPTIHAQKEVFDDALASAATWGIEIQLRHLANSAATLCLPATHYDLVRPGIAIYGVSPGPLVGTPETLGLQPAMTLTARLALAKRLPAGHGVSYAHQYIASQDTNVGLVPLGYADGISRQASGRAKVLIGESLKPIAGRVCMDQFVIELGQEDHHAGDRVVVFGDPARGEPTAHDWAVATDTIAYEVVTTVGPRVPRRYVGG